MISNEAAIAMAQALYQALCERLGKKPHELVGEIAHAEGKRLVVLFNASGKLAAAYRIGDNAVIDLSGDELTKLRTKLTNRKVR